MGSSTQPFQPHRKQGSGSGAGWRPSPRQHPSLGHTEAPLLHDHLGQCFPLSGPQAAPLGWRKPRCHFPPHFRGPSCALPGRLALPSRGLQSGGALPHLLLPGLLLSLTPDIGPDLPLRSQQDQPCSLGVMLHVSPQEEGPREPQRWTQPALSWTSVPPHQPGDLEQTKLRAGPQCSNL